MSKRSKLIFFFLVFLFFTLTANFALANRERWKTPEVQYPQLPDFFHTETPNDFIQKIQSGEYPPEKALPLYVKYFYSLFLMVSGLIAFGAVVYGGFKYLISAGAPPKLVAARDQISGGILGLLIILSSYLILVTINPQLTIFSIPGLVEAEPPTTTIAPRPEPEIPVYFQVPMGKIIENTLLNEVGQRKLLNYKQAAEKSRLRSNVLLGLTRALLLETRNCKCNESICSSAPGCQGIDCASYCNITAINVQKTQISAAITQLRAAQSEIAAASMIAVQDLLELKKSGLLTSLTSGTIDYNMLLVLKHYQNITIDTFPGWENITVWPEGKTNDPITFYFNKTGNEGAIEIANSLSAEAIMPAPPPDWPQPPPPPPPFPPPPPSGEAILDIPALSQRNLSWASQIINTCPASDSCGWGSIYDGNSIWCAGCGPTSLAMVLRYFGYDVYPSNIARQARGGIEYFCGVGSSLFNLAGLARNYGLSYGSISFDAIEENLRAGRPIIASCSSYRGRWSHLTVIKGLQNGFVYFQDPNWGNEVFLVDTVRNNFGCNNLMAFFQP